MTQEEIQRRCREISSAGGRTDCGFSAADADGFIDTSPEQNGSRGIAFFDNRIALNFDGDTVYVPYEDISSVQIISSFEDNFSDEMDICCKNSKLRISDCSVDKQGLKRLIEELCGKSETESYAGSDVVPEENIPAAQPEAPEDKAQSEPALISLSESGEIPENREIWKSEEAFEISYDTDEPEPVFVPDDEAPEDSVSASQLSETENNLKSEQPPISVTESGEIAGTIHQERPEINETDEPSSIPTENDSGENLPADSLSEETENDGLFEEDIFNNDDILREIENMSHEETMEYLSKTLNEINSPVGNSSDAKVESSDRTESEEDVKNNSPDSDDREIIPIKLVPPTIPEQQKKNSLTEEPVWGDIYIKASRSLRELCEKGKLSMDCIEAELKDKLLESAEAFADITKDESKIPKVLIPKITELKNASDNFGQYFSYGEDIAVRAMFFMHFQMLSYADRIVEDPDIKERLNDFFRRFGAAGITLSMLDTRI